MLVQLDALMTTNVEELRVGMTLNRLADGGDELLVGTRFPTLREHTDRVLRIRVEAQWLPKLRRQLDRTKHSGELRDIVRALADVLAQLAHLLPEERHHPESGRPRVPAACAVGIGEDLIAFWRFGRGPARRLVLLWLRRLRDGLALSAKRVGFDRRVRRRAEVRGPREVSAAIVRFVPNLDSSIFMDELTTIVATREYLGVPETHSTPCHGAPVSTSACSVKRSSYPRTVSRSIRLALAVSLVVGVVIYGALEQGQTLRASRALRELPSTTRFVLAIDPGALETSASARALVEAFVGVEQLSDIEATCDLDPMRDLSELVLWVRGSEREPFESFGLSLTGKTVDAAAIAECHRLLVDARGGSVIRLEAPSGPLLASDDRRSAIALVDERTVITGAVRTVAEAMAVRQGRLPALEERSRVAEVWPRVRRGAALAAVFDPPAYWKTALERIPAFGADPSALEGIETVALSAKRGSETTIDVLVDASTPELAERNAEIIRSWVDEPPADVEPPWTEVLRSARIRVEGVRVIATLDVAALATAR